MNYPKSVALIGSAISWGSSRLLGEAGPRSLQAWGFDQILQTRGIAAHWYQIVEAQPKCSNHTLTHQIEALPFVAAHAQQLASAVYQAMTCAQFPVTVGGDHSTAIGHYAGLIQHLATQFTQSAAKETRDRLSDSSTPSDTSRLDTDINTPHLGIIWIDAHADCNRLETSPSMACHGMALAAVLGYGAPELTQWFSQRPIRPENVCLIGTRAVDPGEQEFIDRHQIRVFSPADIQQRGWAVVLNEAVAIATHNTQGFGLSIDLDAFDPIEAPGVAFPEPNGIYAADFQNILPMLLYHANLIGIEISEYAPERDIEYRTAHLISDLLSSR
jgi:arginase